jgi:hypothetical protein
MSNVFTSTSHVPGDEHSGDGTPAAAGDDTETPAGEPMQGNASPLLDGPQCACDALAEERRATCRKCHARSRWQRGHSTRRATRRATGLLVALALLQAGQA